MKITEKSPGDKGATDAFAATMKTESSPFMADLLAVCQKHGLVLVPQSREYEVDFSEPMRVVPLTSGIEKKLNKAWVVFEKESVS